MGHLLNKISDWYFSRTALPYWVVLVLDCLIVFSSNLLVYCLNNDFDVWTANFGGACISLSFYTLFYLLAFRLMHTYAGILRYSSFLDLMRIGAAMLEAIFIIAMLRIFCQLDSFILGIRLRFLCEACVLATALMWLVRIVVKFMYDVFFDATQQTRVFIFGVKEGGVALAKSIRNQKPSRYYLCGFITDNEAEAGKELMARRVYMLDENIVDEMRERKVSTLLVSPLKNEAFRKNAAFQNLLLNAGIKIQMMPSMVEWNGKYDIAPAQLKEVDIVDLLPRDEIDVDMQAIGRLLTGRSILITGSAGSIGSEMVRQIAAFAPRRLVLIDQAETPQHDIRLMMARQWPHVETHTIVMSICETERMDDIFRRYRPEYVFHAAAYKHVPMMEDNPCEAVFNNIQATQNLARVAVKYGVCKFVMISTDKAVNPTNVMGCSKRICEIDVQSMDTRIKQLTADPTQPCPFELADGVKRPVTQFVTTRFGNVLGSNGSVIPLFKKQIREGGPVTVTHPDIIRYFMLIPEACKLVLEAGTMGHGGEIFVFDMGSPVKIADLAKNMIQLSGAKNVEIKFTGLRDGEKLYEEVLNDKESTIPTVHPKILVATVRQYDYDDVCRQLDTLYAAARTFDDMATVRIMKQMVPEFRSQQSKYEELDAIR